MALTPAEIEQFVTQGFVRIDGAFPRRLADEGRAILWRRLGCDPDDRSTWTRPVMRLPLYQDAPFAAAIKAPAAGSRAMGSAIRWCAFPRRKNRATPAGTSTPAFRRQPATSSTSANGA
jgi:hypothetical protein